MIATARNLAALALDLARALWIAATDSTRGAVCGVCKSKRCKGAC